MAERHKHPELESDLASHSHPPHEHGLVEHEHSAWKHSHPLEAHEHKEGHKHPELEHGHDHRHADLTGPIRGLLDVIEAGSVSAAQRAAIRHVRLWLGDAHADYCLHELTVYEEGDRLICQKCRADLTPKL